VGPSGVVTKGEPPGGRQRGSFAGIPRGFSPECSPKRVPRGPQGGFPVGVPRVGPQEGVPSGRHPGWVPRGCPPVGVPKGVHLGFGREVRPGGPQR
jgi:hypothetical protein